MPHNVDDVVPVVVAGVVVVVVVASSVVVVVDDDPVISRMPLTNTGSEGIFYYPVLT